MLNKRGLMDKLTIKTPKVNLVFTDRMGWEGGEGLLSGVGDHILQEFITLNLTRFRTYKIVFPPQTKT